MNNKNFELIELCQLSGFNVYRLRDKTTSKEYIFVLPHSGQSGFLIDKSE